jgi:hypothetical protein
MEDILRDKIRQEKIKILKQKIYFTRPLEALEKEYLKDLNRADLVDLLLLYDKCVSVDRAPKSYFEYLDCCKDPIEEIMRR